MSENSGASERDLGNQAHSSEKLGGVEPSAFVTFLKENLDKHGKPPAIPHDGDLPDLTKLREFQLPLPRKGMPPAEKGVTITERSDQVLGIKYEVTDANGDVYTINPHDNTAERTAIQNGENQVVPVTDFADLQESMLELQRPVSTEFTDRFEKYGGSLDVVAKMRNHRGVSSKPHLRRVTSGRRKIAEVATAAAVLAGAFGIGTSVSQNSEPLAPPPGPGIEGPVVPGPTETENTVFAEREQQVREEMQGIGKDVAISILADLDKPNTGTEQYAQTRIGNKKALIGPDGEFPTADDAQYRQVPEMFAFFDPDRNNILIQSTSVHGEGDTATFYSVETVFAVDPNNPITKNPDQLTTTDFRDALSGDATILEGISIGDATGFNEETGERSGQRFGIYLKGQNLIVGRDTNASLLTGYALADAVPEVTESSNLNELSTIDGLNLSLHRLTEISESVTTQLSNDSSQN